MIYDHSPMDAETHRKPATKENQHVHLGGGHHI